MRAQGAATMLASSSVSEAPAAPFKVIELDASWDRDAFAATLTASGRSSGATLPWSAEVELWDLIDIAWSRAKDRDLDAACEAVERFRARLRGPDLTDFRALSLAAEGEKLIVEEQAFRTQCEAGHEPGRPDLAVLTDSLGLLALPPGAPTYVGLLAEPGGWNVTPVARRFSTSADYAGDLARVPLKDAVVLLHRGVNDYAPRVFEEAERRVVAGLPSALRVTLIRFVTQFRAQLTEASPLHAYVDLEAWRANLEGAMAVARAGGARAIVVVNIMRYPDRMNRPDPRSDTQRIDRFNAVLADVCERTGAFLVDMDGANVRSDYQLVLSDYIHLNEAGHQFLADAVAGVARSAATSPR